MIAVSNGHYEFAFAESNGFTEDFSHLDKNSRGIIHRAAFQLDSFLTTINDDKFSNVPDCNGVTPLHIAAAVGSLFCILAEILLIF